MDECQQFDDSIAAYMAGDIGPALLEELLAHTGECADCRGLVELHRSLAGAEQPRPEPSDHAFAAMRAGVIDELEGRLVHSRAPRSSDSMPVAAGTGVWHSVWEWLGHRPVLAPALFVTLLGGAALLGRQTVAVGWSDRALLNAVQEQAAASTGLDGFWDAPFTFANVDVRQVQSGDLALGFDVCRHVEAQTPRSSPLATEVLLATILDSPTLGVRIRAMDVAPGTPDARLQEALVYTLHNDPNLAVRVQALSVLSRSGPDEVTQGALLTTLRQDTAVQMRLLALEALVESNADPERIRRAVSESGQPGDAVVMQRAMQVIGAS